MYIKPLHIIEYFDTRAAYPPKYNITNIRMEAPWEKNKISIEYFKLLVTLYYIDY